MSAKCRKIEQASLVAAVEQAADSIIITDTTGRIQYVNPAFSAMTGYSSAEAIGQNTRVLKSGDQPQEFYKQLWDTIVSGQRWHGELVNRRKDGTQYCEEMQVTPVRNSLGEIASFIAIKRDVTERRASEDAKAFLATIVESSEDAIVASTPEGIIMTWNRGAEALLGYTRDEMIGHSALKYVPPESRSHMADCMRRNSTGETIAQLEVVCRHKDGRDIEVSLTSSPIKNSEGKVTSTVAIMLDITKRRQAEEALLFKTALLEGQMETSLDGILVVDEASVISLANRQFALIFGVPCGLLNTANDLLVREHVMDTMTDPEAFRKKVEYLYGHRQEKSRDELRLKSGMILDRYSSPLVDSAGKYRGRIWYFRDITDGKAAEERSQFLALHDALTGLPQRTLLQDRMGTALAGARRRDEKVALLYLDVDRFKNINDTFGHAYGDDVLKEVARRLREFSREQDTVARLSGDEFMVMLTGVKDAAGVAIAAQRLLDTMKPQFLVREQALNVGCSIGVSIFPEHGTDGETLIKNADEALYSAKDRGRGNVRFFTDRMNVQVTERLTLDRSLRLALNQEEFFLVYQPQVETETGRIIGLEALIRWQHPKLGLLSPDRFIPIAENNGLILPIGEWVLRTACAQARKWQDDGLPAVPVAVNVSPIQFRQESFCALIRKVLQETVLAPQYLELELTEGLLLANSDATLSVLRELKEMGLNLAIDDFGTGYSNLSFLKQFPVDKLKIDRSFVRDIAVDCDDRAITSAIISMAKSLHLRVIAEGVESEAQMSFLRKHRCDEIQGYYFSEPLSADDAAVKMQSGPSYEVGLVPLRDSRTQMPPFAVARQDDNTGAPAQDKARSERKHNVLYWRQGSFPSPPHAR
jgi:diguanylate cyclase (GGDEF)-like protein/PAS domain S-box-containing protein